MSKFIIGILFFAVLVSFAGSSMSEEREITKKYDIDSETLDLFIEIGAGEIEIVPSRSNNRLIIYAEYHEEYCELNFSYDERRDRMRIWTDQKLLSSEDNHDNSGHKRDLELTIELPRDPEIELAVKLKAGEADIQLGGLSISDFELDNYAGEVDIDFNTPNRINMDTFDVNCKIGETNIYNLGNSHFNYAVINGAIGEMGIDFSGDILDDASAVIDLELGETSITIPSEIGTRMKISRFMFFNPDFYYSGFNKKGSYYYSKNYDKNYKEFSLKVSLGMGELNIKTK